jgi:hypothetical protein
MANPQKGEVALPIGEKTLTMRFGRNELAAAEKVLGKTWPEIVAEMDSESAGFSTIIGLVWASLQRNHPGMTLFDVGDLLDTLSDDALVGEKITEALNLAFPKVSAGNPQ